uniref:Uncharacterized protein n=1 Tax=Vespula pensylvanica TaxID=30213 RepID=A0A834NQ54_VESPE|nr:hypothetical protein H0235_011981 [Vespula pensylvanica]
MAVWLANANETAKILSPVHNLSSAGAKKPDKRFPARTEWNFSKVFKGSTGLAYPSLLCCQTLTFLGRLGRNKSVLWLIIAFVDFNEMALKPLAESVNGSLKRSYTEKGENP